MPVIRTLVKVLVASLIVGTILNHFGITPEQIMRETGITTERASEIGRQALNWALPNLLLGALVIVPVWFLIFLFRPPGAAAIDAALVCLLHLSLWERKRRCGRIFHRR